MSLYLPKMVGETSEPLRPQAKGLLVLDRPIGEGLGAADGGSLRRGEACEEHLELLRKTVQIAEELSDGNSTARPTREPTMA